MTGTADATHRCAMSLCIPQTQILVFGSDRLVAPASNWPLKWMVHATQKLVAERNPL
jgi:hypothetical protein